MGRLVFIASCRTAAGGRRFSGARRAQFAPLAALPAPRLTPVPTVPAMARPAMPASAISLSVLPEPASAAGAAVAPTAVSGSAGNVYEMGFTAGVATVHVGGTDKAPIVLASPNPAERLGGGSVPARRLSRGAGNGFTGAGPVSGQALFPVPAADDVIGVDTGAITADVEGKGHDPQTCLVVRRRKCWPGRRAGRGKWKSGR